MKRIQKCDQLHAALNARFLVVHVYTYKSYTLSKPIVYKIPTKITLTHHFIKDKLFALILFSARLPIENIIESTAKTTGQNLS